VASKDRKRDNATEGSNKLAHNPFASLKDRLGLPSAPTPEPAAEHDVGARTSAREQDREAPTKKRSLGRLIQRRETKQRGGKAVIVVSGFAALSGFDRGAVEEIARALKGKLGSGGTVEEGKAGLEIVIQGDQAKRVAELLRERGFRVDGVTS
jgi:translation initiation factor 1 (eIF-1/SUI1)